MELAHFKALFIFRTQIAPEKNKNGFKDNKNKDWRRGRRWPPEPKVGGSNPSWRTRLISIEIGEKLSIFEGFFFLCILKFTHLYSNFNATLTKLK